MWCHGSWAGRTDLDKSRLPYTDPVWRVAAIGMRRKAFATRTCSRSTPWCARRSGGYSRTVRVRAGENQAAAAARGVNLGAPYKDESISASRYSTKTRDDFVRLLSDLDAVMVGCESVADACGVSDSRCRVG